MEISPATVFHKTEQGTEELKTRAHGLAPRLRQLLILVDGKRDVTEIARVLPQPELDAQIAQLANGGFIASRATSGARSGADTPESPPVGSGVRSPQPRAGNPGASLPRAPAVSAAGSDNAAASAVSAAAAAVVDRLRAAAAVVDRLTAVTEPQHDAAVQSAKPAAPLAPAEDLRTLRGRVTQALLDIVGPNGDDFAIRIERVASVGELRAMVPAMLSVIEAIGGRRGVDRFLERCGPI